MATTTITTIDANKGSFSIVSDDFDYTLSKQNAPDFVQYGTSPNDRVDITWSKGGEPMKLTLNRKDLNVNGSTFANQSTLKTALANLFFLAGSGGGGGGYSTPEEVNDALASLPEEDLTFLPQNDFPEFDENSVGGVNQYTIKPSAIEDILKAQTGLPVKDTLNNGDVWWIRVTGGIIQNPELIIVNLLTSTNNFIIEPPNGGANAGVDGPGDAGFNAADGTQTASKIRLFNTGGYRNYTKNGILTPLSTYTWGLEMIDKPLSNVRININGTDAIATFNLTTGTISGNTAGTAFISPLANGWKLVGFTFVASSANFIVSYDPTIAYGSTDGWGVSKNRLNAGSVLLPYQARA